MAKTSVIFKFEDGAKEVKIGDTFYVASGAKWKGNSVMKITAIGNKYVTAVLEYNGSTYGAKQFVIESGLEKSDYTSQQSYSSQEAYEQIIQETKFIQEVFKKITPNGYGINITYKQAIKINAILEEK